MRYESDQWADSRTGGLRSLALHTSTQKRVDNSHSCSWDMKTPSEMRLISSRCPTISSSWMISPATELPTCKDAKQKSLEFFIAKGPKKPETRNYRHYRYKKRGPLNQTPPLYIKRCFINYFGSMDKGIPLQKHYL